MPIFTTPSENIQAAIELLFPGTYSLEYMNSIGWDKRLAEDPLLYDITLAVHLLGAKLASKEDFRDIN